MSSITIDTTVHQQWTEHKRVWRSCTRCGLCKTRTNTAIFRGNIPCTVLFIGEAPGESEDILGYPFVGPSGILLDDMIEQVEQRSQYKPEIGITNIVACFPNVEREIRKPTPQEAAACKPRLDEIIELCKPKLIVTLGQIPKKYLPKLIGIQSISLVHPASILRNQSDQLAQKRFVLTLSQQYALLKKVCHAC